MSQPEKYLERAKEFVDSYWELRHRASTVRALADLLHDVEVEVRNEIADKVLISPLTKIVLAGEIRKGNI